MVDPGPASVQGPSPSGPNQLSRILALIPPLLILAAVIITLALPLIQDGRVQHDLRLLSIMALLIGGVT